MSGGGSAPRISSGGGPQISGGAGPRAGSGGGAAPRASGNSAPRASVGSAPRGGGGSAPRISGGAVGSAPRAAEGVSPRINTEVGRGKGPAAIARPTDGGGPPALGAGAGAQARGSTGGRVEGAGRDRVSGAKGATVGNNNQVRGPTGDVAGGKARGNAADRGAGSVDRQVTRASANRPQVERINEMLGVRGRGEGSARAGGPGAAGGPGGTQFTSSRASWSENVRSAQVDRVRNNLDRANQNPVRSTASTRNWLSSNPDRAKHWNDYASGARNNWNSDSYHNGHHDGHHNGHHHHYHSYFTPGWWALNSVWFPWHHCYYGWGGYQPWTYWWGCPTWGGLRNWYGGWGWNDPCYYDYGYGGNVVYVDRYVYVNGQPVASAVDYAQSAADLAATPPSPAIADQVGEWLALGTFAITTSKEDTNPARMIQLAVDKEGNVSGTMVNKTTNKTYPVQGRVDKQTQRVAFTIGDNKDVVLETGIYNLTQQETPVLVHQGTDRTETYLMLRLEAPKEEEKVDGSKTENLLP
jgi:hypothetical protein